MTSVCLPLDGLGARHPCYSDADTTHGHGNGEMHIHSHLVIHCCDIVLKIFVLTQQCKYKPRTELKMYKNYQGLNRENSVK